MKTKEELGRQIRALIRAAIRKKICEKEEEFGAPIRAGIREEGAGEQQSATWVLQWLSH